MPKMSAMSEVVQASRGDLERGLSRSKTVTGSLVDLCSCTMRQNENLVLVRSRAVAANSIVAWSVMAGVLDWAESNLGTIQAWACACVSRMDEVSIPARYALHIIHRRHRPTRHWYGIVQRWQLQNLSRSKKSTICSNRGIWMTIVSRQHQYFQFHNAIQV